VSANWAGYVASGASFSSVSGSWVEPSVRASVGSSYAAIWVGLGGSSRGSNALEQVGTQADWVNGRAVHYAWYELVPSAPVRLPLSIRAGDRISARVTVSGSRVTISLLDRTTGRSVTRRLTMSAPDTSSADWIVEAPSECGVAAAQSCRPLRLSDFSKVSFTGASATAAAHAGPIDDRNWHAEAVALMPAGDGYAFPGARLGARFVPGWLDSALQGGAAPTALRDSGHAFAVSYLADAGLSGRPCTAGALPAVDRALREGWGWGYPGDGYPGFWCGEASAPGVVARGDGRGLPSIASLGL